MPRPMNEYIQGEAEEGEEDAQNLLPCGLWLIPKIPNKLPMLRNLRRDHVRDCRMGAGTRPQPCLVYPEREESQLMKFSELANTWNG